MYIQIYLNTHWCSDAGPLYKAGYLIESCFKTLH